MAKRNLDKFDLEAEAQAAAIRTMRHNGSAPVSLGKRSAGAKIRYMATKPATSHAQNRLREEKIGFGA